MYISQGDVCVGEKKRNHKNEKKNGDEEKPTTTLTVT
jgi:hypothetical protein